VVGEYAPAPKITVERILPRSPTPGDVVTLTIRAEDPNVGIPFLVINGTRVLASYLEEQPAYLYRFTYKSPTTVPIQAPGGTPITIQIGQPTTTQTTPAVTTPTVATPPTTTPTPTAPTPTPTPTTAPTPTPTPSPTGAVSASTPTAATPTVTSSVVTAAPAAPSGLPVEVVASVVIAVVGAVVLALLARKK
jgi:cytoskeletal protein RodZ